MPFIAAVLPRRCDGCGDLGCTPRRMDGSGRCGQGARYRIGTGRSVMDYLRGVPARPKTMQYCTGEARRSHKKTKSCPLRIILGPISSTASTTIGPSVAGWPRRRN